MSVEEAVRLAEFFVDYHGCKSWTRTQASQGALLQNDTYTTVNKNVYTTDHGSFRSLGRHAKSFSDKLANMFGIERSRDAHRVLYRDANGLLSNGDFEMAPTDKGARDGPVSIPDWKSKGKVEMIESGQRAARTCAQLESLNISVPPAPQTIDLQTFYTVPGWDA
ncbi:hypothetical protein IFM89_038217 [Coptis chinensis]|uniref:DUF642 domain-containing protein n=1 Tax=Coptis chinensis TaxID=261450 RepID=A0A835IJX8_9MAGN|nr:hypothetical protein IFM89_038217 [Coptis chinensis]